MEEPKFKDISKMSFSECLSELEGIVRMMESDKCDIDQLAAYTTRATVLLDTCRSKLTATDRELQNRLSGTGENS